MKTNIQKSKILPHLMRYFCNLQILFLLLNSAVFCQSNFQEFLDRVNSTISVSSKQAIVDSFMTYARSVGIPYLEDSTVYFIYKLAGLSKIKNKSIASKSIILKVYNGVITAAMKNIESTDFYYSSITFLSDARVDYHFEIDGNKVLDSENPLKIIGNSFGDVFSELRMPGYAYPAEIDYNPLIPHGTREKTIIHSDLLDWDYDIEVYLPPSYYTESDKKYPISYHQDGQNLHKDCIGTVNVLDNLIYQNKIEEIILVGVYSYIENREITYVGSKKNQYESFILKQVIPYIESKYRVMNDPKSRCIGGVSYGGPISAQIAYNNPDLFGLCILVSPSFQANSVLDSVTNGISKDIKFYVDWGFYESFVRTTSGRFRDRMLAKNYELEWHEWPDGHVYGNFRAHQDNAYIFIFPSKNSVGIEEKNQNINEHILFQNYPNPFNPSTTIEYSIPRESFVTIKVFNILGNEIKILLNERKTVGNYSIDFDANNLPSGVYFYRMQAIPEGRQAGSFVSTKKFVLLK